jgi:hypothetical protein
MPYNKYVIIIFFILYLQFILPIELIMDAFSAQPVYLITFIHAFITMVFLFFAAPWDYTIYKLRYFYLGLLFLGLSYSFLSLITSGELLQFQQGWMLKQKSTILWTIVFSYIVFNIIKARVKQKNSIDLKFPFKDGHYLITEGGDGKASFFSNYHYRYWKSKMDGYQSMRFATDIIKLDSLGFSKKGIVPVDNNMFYTYDEPVFSPIDGEVFRVKDVYDDHPAHSGKYPLGVGNMVVIKKDDYYILLGHLKKGKTVVTEGQKIKAGELVGAIGMTGYTPRPHLHMQVSQSTTGDLWGGRGIPITFDRKVPSKNTLFKA